jgi:hypothetical protein
MSVPNLIVEADSTHFRILARLCAMPGPVRGISRPMLNRVFSDPRAIDELARAKLIRQRGWHDGPGGIWVPTEAGEALFEELSKSAG